MYVQSDMHAPDAYQDTATADSCRSLSQALIMGSTASQHRIAGHCDGETHKPLSDMTSVQPPMLHDLCAVIMLSICSKHCMTPVGCSDLWLQVILDQLTFGPVYNFCFMAYTSMVVHGRGGLGYLVHTLHRTVCCYCDALQTSSVMCTTHKFNVQSDVCT